MHTITGVIITLALLPFFLPERLWPWFIRDPASCTPFEGAAQRWKQARQDEAEQEPDDDGSVVILGAGQVFETPPVPETILLASDGEFCDKMGAMYEMEANVRQRAQAAVDDGRFVFKAHGPRPPKDETEWNEK